MNKMCAAGEQEPELAGTGNRSGKYIEPTVSSTRPDYLMCANQTALNGQQAAWSDPLC